MSVEVDRGVELNRELLRKCEPSDGQLIFALKLWSKVLDVLVVNEC